MSAHTPGPWVSFCYGPDGTKVLAGDVVVATLPGHARGDKEAADALVADGYLIEASPDLLAALTEAEDALGYRLADASRSPIMRRIRAAIAKAKGKAPSTQR